MKAPGRVLARAGLRWLVALLLIGDAVGKLGDLREFYAALLGYQLPLPALLLRGVAIVLPWVELLCGLLLLTGPRNRGALAWTLVLAVLFALGTGQAALRGLDIGCGCFSSRLPGFGPGSTAAAWFGSLRFAFLRALGLGAASLYLLRRDGGA